MIPKSFIAPGEPIDLDRLEYGPKMCAKFGCIHIMSPWENLYSNYCYLHQPIQRFDTSVLLQDEDIKTQTPEVETTGVKK